VQILAGMARYAANSSAIREASPTQPIYLTV
jgi:hypothetical protein